MRFITYGGSASSIALLVMACPSVLGGKTSFVTTIICYSNSFNYAVNGVTVFSASAKLFLKNNTAPSLKRFLYLLHQMSDSVIRDLA
jgi:hypothetical protein